MIDFAINLHNPNRVMTYECHTIHHMGSVINGEALLYQTDPDQSHRRPGCTIPRYIC